MIVKLSDDHTGIVTNLLISLIVPSVNFGGDPLAPGLLDGEGVRQLGLLQEQSEAEFFNFDINKPTSY